MTEKEEYDRGYQDGMRDASNDFTGPCVKDGEKVEFIKRCYRCDMRTPFVRRKIHEDQSEWLVCALCNEQ